MDGIIIMKSGEFGMMEKEKYAMIEKVKYAIFDMDGTLVNSLGYFDYLWEALGRKYLSDPTFRVDAEVDKMIRTKTLKDACVILRDIYFKGEDADEIFALATEGLEEHYKLRVEAKAGAVEFLKELKERGVKMCVASATEPRLVNYSIERCGLCGFFDFIISCTEVGCGKEKPDIFLEAMKRLGGNLSESCVFEDSFIAIETAKRAGFMTVGVYDSGNYNHDRLAASSDFYVPEGCTLLDMLK